MDIVIFMVDKKIENFNSAESSVSNEIFLLVEHLTKNQFQDVSFELKKWKIFGFTESRRPEVLNAVFVVNRSDIRDMYSYMPDI